MKLYHYDHCPYCAKARMIFGFKNIPFEDEILLNDDEDTPIKMVEKKVVPILKKADGSFMPESLDIVKYVDENFGSGEIVSYSSPRQEIKDWLYSSRNYVYDLAMPRWVKMPLKEFKTQSAKDYFQTKKEKNNIGLFSIALEKTPEFIQKAESELKYLENLMLENGRFYNDSVHIDDFHIFTTLRSLTTVKNLKWPPKLLSYLKSTAEKSKVNLYFDLAL
jgi:glutaredoxin 2